MINIRKTWWIWILLAGLCIYGISQYSRYYKAKNNPCLTETQGVLMDRYPQLKELKDKQDDETEKLLEKHRQQDVIVNLKMSNAELSPDQALRISIGQIDQVAAMRKRQNEDFENMCQEVVANTK